MSTTINPRMPVLIGVADVIDRPEDGEKELSPVDMLAWSIEEAIKDTQFLTAKDINSLHIINVMSWPYKDIVGSLLNKIGISPSVAEHTPASGDTVQRRLHEAANKIASGDIDVAVICGAECFKTLFNALKEKRSPKGWPDPDPNYVTPSMSDIVDEETMKYGFSTAVSVYALYENAIRANSKKTLIEAQQETAELWSKMSKIASGVPAAWIKNPCSPEEIIEPTAGNRPIAFPYNKLMIANDAVNQAAAMVITTYENAKKHGIEDDRIVFVGAGANAWDTENFLERDSYIRSVTIETVIESVLEKAQLNSEDFDFVEFYSCFPCVPKIAADVFPLKANQVPTTIGGLTFFGGPGNNYMTHAVVGMVRQLRKSGKNGLLLGNGDLLTKHHATVLTKEVPNIRFPFDYNVQVQADKRRGETPSLINSYEGPSTLETYTVIYKRDQQPAYGAVICRTEEGERFVARVLGEDKNTIDLLVGEIRPWKEPIGTKGSSYISEDGFTVWSVN